MVGKGRHRVLALTSPDPVLSLVGSIGLAASAGTALVVDLADVRADSGRRTIHDMATDGPTLTEMSPGRQGVAMIRGGGVDLASADRIVEELAVRWPAVVVRRPAGASRYPTVPAIPLYPGRLLPAPDVSHCVWQPVGGGSDAPAPGLVLPRLRPGTMRRLLAGQLPKRSRWVGAWQRVWEMPWA